MKASHENPRTPARCHAFSLGEARVLSIKESSMANQMLCTAKESRDKCLNQGCKTAPNTHPKSILLVLNAHRV